MLVMYRFRAIVFFGICAKVVVTLFLLADSQIYGMYIGTYLQKQFNDKQNAFQVIMAFVYFGL